MRSSTLIKEEATRLGFAHCGISKAEFLETEAPRVERWLKNNMHGQMYYMENHFDKRLDPTKLVEGAKSVISLAYNYFPKQVQENKDAPKIAKYAYGEDYHFVVRRKVKELLLYIQETIGAVDGRAFVDSAPVMERAWAAKSGLGWVGKNSLLLNKQMGSFFFLAELIIDLPLEYDQPVTDHCGSCTKCMDACPTDAIPKPYTVDGSKCISYFTIELKEKYAIPENVKGKFENWAFGCDICQDVCPWNRFSKPHHEEAFEPKEEMLKMTKKEWHEITEDVFQKLFKKTPLKRTKYKGIKRNLKFLELIP